MVEHWRLNYKDEVGQPAPPSPAFPRSVTNAVPAARFFQLSRRRRGREGGRERGRESGQFDIPTKPKAEKERNCAQVARPRDKSSFNEKGAKKKSRRGSVVVKIGRQRDSWGGVKRQQELGTSVAIATLHCPFSHILSLFRRKRKEGV